MLQKCCISVCGSTDRQTITIVEKRLENLRFSEAFKVIFDDTKTAIDTYNLHLLKELRSRNLRANSQENLLVKNTSRPRQFIGKFILKHSIKQN